MTRLSCRATVLISRVSTSCSRLNYSLLPISSTVLVRDAGNLCWQEEREGGGGRDYASSLQRRVRFTRVYIRIYVCRNRARARHCRKLSRCHLRRARTIYREDRCFYYFCKCVNPLCWQRSEKERGREKKRRIAVRGINGTAVDKDLSDRQLRQLRLDLSGRSSHGGKSNTYSLDSPSPPLPPLLLLPSKISGDVKSIVGFLGVSLLWSRESGDRRRYETSRRYPRCIVDTSTGRVFNGAPHGNSQGPATRQKGERPPHSVKTRHLVSSTRSTRQANVALAAVINKGIIGDPLSR